MDWKPQIHQLKAYQPGKSIADVKEMYGLDDIVKLASNENPFGCSSLVTDYLKEATTSFATYPDGYAKALRLSLADHLQVSPTQILLGNGSDEIIAIISRALLDSGKNTVMATPTSPQYKHNAIIEGAEVREVPLDSSGKHQLDKMLEAIDESTSIVWLCSPNNPSGEYIRRQEIRSFLERVGKDVLVVIDEAYYEYVVADDFYDSLELLKEFPQLLVTRTFSKAYGLAGFRVGYAIANEAVIQKLEPVREPFNNNTLGQGAAAIALNDQQFILNCREENRKGLEQYYQFCKEEGLHYTPSQGNFILIDFGIDGDEVFTHLMSKGYIVRSGKALGAPTAVRVTVGSTEQNDGVIQEMRLLLKDLKKQV